MRRVTLMILVMLGFALPAWADVIIFDNADTLTGKLVKIEKGKIAFKADQTGNVVLDIARIRTLSTDQPVELHLADGTTINTRLLIAQPGAFSTEATSLLPAQTFALSDLNAVNPTTKPKPPWTGSVSVGLSSTHGNTFTENANINFDATKRTEKDRTHLHGLYLVQRTEEINDAGNKEKITTEESLTIAGKYDYFFNEKLFAFINASFKKDHIADLDRRIIAGLGLGYQWIESEKMNFNTTAGLAELCEQYTSFNPTTLSVETTKTDDLSAQFGYHFDRKINHILTFMHNLTYYPSLEKLSSYFLTTDAEIRAALTESLFANFKVILDYDSTPAPNIGTTDTKYSLGIGWTF